MMEDTEETVPCHHRHCCSNDGKGTCVEWFCLRKPRHCGQRLAKYDDYLSALSRAEKAEAALERRTKELDRARASLRGFCSEDDDCGQVDGKCNATCWVFAALADEPEGP